MGELHELRVRSNQFIANIQSYIESVVDDNEDLLNLNREQLKKDHAGIDDSPITPPYSPAYAQFKGFKTPDIFLTGETQQSMTIEAKGEQYIITAHTDQVPELNAKYGGMLWGIGPKRQPKAQKITTELLAKVYKESVLKNS